MEKNMGKQRVVNKAISPAEIIKALQFGNITTAQAQQMFNGFIPIGDFRNIASIFDLDKLVVQPLIWAEKQWTLDRVDPRKGMCHLTIDEGSLLNSLHTAEIVVPADEVWYLCEHEIRIHAAPGPLTAGDVLVNFLVSSFPKVAGADKAYYLATDPQVYLVDKQGADNAVMIAGLTAGFAVIAVDDIVDHKLIPLGHTAGVLDAWYSRKRDFRDGDELNTELRLVGGDKLTLTATVLTAAATVGDDIDVDLRVWGRVGKLLVT